MPSLKIGDDSHPETHWKHEKHEKPLPGCDCITRVTHELLTVVASGVLHIFMTWSNIDKLQFLGYNSFTT